jgi:hypothetical protein
MPRCWNGWRKTSWRASPPGEGRGLGVGGCHAGRDPCRPARLPACAEERREPNKREAQRIEKLQAKMQEVAEAVDAARTPTTRTRPMPAGGRRSLGEQLQALEDGLQDYGANVKAAAGAIVTIDRNGEAVIHRGLLREAEAKALRTLESCARVSAARKPRTTTKARKTKRPRQPPCPTGWRSA